MTETVGGGSGDGGGGAIAGPASAGGIPVVCDPTATTVQDNSKGDGSLALGRVEFTPHGKGPK